MPPQWVRGGARGVGPPQWREGRGGGLVVDWNLKTNLEGLYAAGHQAAGELIIDRKQVEEEKTHVNAPVKRKGDMGWKGGRNDYACLFSTEGKQQAPGLQPYKLPPNGPTRVEQVYHRQTGE